jgi:hypothetical protein
MLSSSIIYMCGKVPKHANSSTIKHQRVCGTGLGGTLKLHPMSPITQGSAQRSSADPAWATPGKVIRICNAHRLVITRSLLLCSDLS